MSYPPHRRSPDHVEDRRDRVAELTRAGLTAPQIAVRLRITARTVVRDRAARGCVKPQPPQLTGDELARAAQLLDDGCSYAEVARTLGRSNQAIARHFPDRGWRQPDMAQFALSVRHAGVFK